MHKRRSGTVTDPRPMQVYFSAALSEPFSFEWHFPLYGHPLHPPPHEDTPLFLFLTIAVTTAAKTAASKRETDIVPRLFVKKSIIM